MDFLNDAELPPISSYQENAIIELKTNNIIIDSVAGCGKTTTNMYIGKIFNTSNILLLTYNSKLKLETREKVKIYGISNIEIHSYHSFCVKNYDRECFTDEKLIHVLENNQPPFNDFDYDIIILDEAQDINPTLYNLICKIYKDNKSNSKLCVLGDKNQSIYDFNFADSRYITFADIIFNFNKLRWSKCTLPFSFRITHEMAEFINNCMMDKPRIYSKKISDDKPDYICCNIFRLYHYIKPYLKNFGGRYEYNDIFILAASVKKSRNPSFETPIRKLANDLSKVNIPIFVPNSDEEKLDESILNDKIVFSTFHQSKGLERKIVFVIGFDDSYFELFNRSEKVNRKICPNVLYVATTRAKEKLVLFHSDSKKHLPFVNASNIRIYCNVINRISDIKKEKPNQNKPKPIGVTQLIKHLPETKVMDWISRVQFKIKKRIKSKIDIPYKTDQYDGRCETVSEITGTMIPAYYEYSLTNKMTIFNELNKKEIKKIHDKCQDIKQRKKNEEYKNTENYMEFMMVDNDVSDDSESDDEIEEYVPPDIEKLQLSNAKISDLLYISNLYDAQKTKYIFKPIQMKYYNWLSEDNLQKCLKRLKKLKIDSYSKHEIRLSHGNELFNEYYISEIVGYVDCIQNNKLYEFKCTSKLNNEHRLQLMVYMWLFEHYKNDNNITDSTKYYLYNILTDEMYELQSDIITLNKIVKEIVVQKYIGNYNTSDIEFIKNQKEIMNTYKY